MKLRNKKTGEKVDLLEIVRLNDISDEFYLRLSDNEGRTFKVGFNSLAELNDGWEDYEEPKEYWYIDYDGGILCGEKDGSSAERMMISMGNYFESLEEAEKAVEKLQAWKRLKDKGFRFHEWYKPDGCEPFIVVETNIDLDDVDNMKLQKDLDLLFGGEE